MMLGECVNVAGLFDLRNGFLHDLYLFAKPWMHCDK
jgi:hypothetical protein